jgi:hypothetical protein
VKLECDRQIINNDIENRRKELANAFGADFGEPGRNYNLFLIVEIGGNANAIFEF